MAERILILGGARSGKSTYAEKLARELGGDDVLFVATAEAFDDEMRERIAMHRAARTPQWQTLEAPLHLVEQLQSVQLPPVVLIDCITLLAANILLTLSEDCTQEEATQTIVGEVQALLNFQQATDSKWIMVTNEVGMGVVPPSKLGRLYRDALGTANQRIAQLSDQVLLMVAGLAWHLK